MDFNRDHVGTRQVWIAEAMGCDVRGLDTKTASALGRKAVKDLVTDLELPSRLRDVGVEVDDFPAIAKDALEDLVVATNPRPVGSVEDVIEVLHGAW
jgi:alcohol dehydrogenase